jgi:ATP-dependent exoDNAse (exonuclease V) beta subunit
MNTATNLDSLLERLDNDQREAVRCDVNCVVVAGAGSGKTTVLAYRFLRLILDRKAHADEILTLTFSRAAAAEMHERIHTMLLKHKDDPLVAQELERFPDAAISTIDSFCKRIVATDSVRYGYAPDAQLDDDANKILAAECAIALINAYGNHPGMAFLASHCDPSRLIPDLFVSMATEMFHPTDTFEAKYASEALSSYLKASISAMCGEVKTNIDVLKQLQGSGKAYIETLQSCTHLELLCERLKEQWFVDEHFLAQLQEVTFNKRAPSSWEHADAFKSLVDSIRVIVGRLVAACRAIVDLPVAQGVFEIVELYRDRYLEVKSRNGILTFSDIARMAVDILTVNTGVRSYYKNRYKYVMIDEFQDNNQLQKDLLYLISERTDILKRRIPAVHDLESGKLFFVGDEKQSIYRFRGADVSVFKALAHELESHGGRVIRLRTNYRSEPELIDFFNTVFEQAMSNHGEPYEADFHRLEAGVKRDINLAVQPSVTVAVKTMESVQEGEPSDASEGQPVDEEELLTAVEAEAYWIANLINEMVASDRYLIPCEDHLLRRPRHDDIAILYRTGNNQLHYEKALRLSGIPYTIKAVQSLFLEAPINDVYSLLQLVVYPSDRLAYVAVLRSPVCRLSDPAILSMLDQYDRTGQPFGQDDDCRTVLATLSEEDRQAFNATAMLYRQLLSCTGRVPIAHLVAMVWYDGSYRYHLLAHPSRHVYLEHGEYMLELARQYDERGFSLAEYLDFIRPRLGKNEKVPDLEILREQTKGVHLMTIHASKGLEFPIVIVANMGVGSRSVQTPCWVQLVAESQTIPVPQHMEDQQVQYPKKRAIGNFVYERQREAIEAQETAEMKRLLYVALTRAKAHLVMTGCESRWNNYKNAHTKILLRLLQHSLGIEAFEPQQHGEVRIDTIPDVSEAVFRLPVSRRDMLHNMQSIRRFYDEAQADLLLTQRAVVAVTTLVHADLVALYETGKHAAQRLQELPVDAWLLDENLSSAFGTWCHALIAHAVVHIKRPYEAIPLVTVIDPLTLMPKGLQALNDSKQRVMAASAEALANNFLRSQLFMSILADNPESIEAEKEFAWRTVVDGRPTLVYGAVDLMATYADEVRIVDFKTDFERIDGLHEPQVSIYRQAVAAITGKRVKSTVCYIRACGGERWST